MHGFAFSLFIKEGKIIDWCPCSRTAGNCGNVREWVEDGIRGRENEGKERMVEKGGRK
jgi:hypothetical protein